MIVKDIEDAVYLIKADDLISFENKFLVANGFTFRNYTFYKKSYLITHYHDLSYYDISLYYSVHSNQELGDLSVKLKNMYWGDRIIITKVKEYSFEYK
jgi:hypothetical protein